MAYAAILVLLLILAVVFLVPRTPKGNSVQKAGGNNVILFDKHRETRNKSGEQPCSSCKKINGKLIFYAQDNGTIVGLCKNCRVKAKKQDMLPL